MFSLLNTDTDEERMFETIDALEEFIKTKKLVTHGRIIDHQGYTGPAFGSNIVGTPDLNCDPSTGDRWDSVYAEVIYVAYNIPNSILRQVCGDPEMEFGLGSSKVVMDIRAFSDSETEDADANNESVTSSESDSKPVPRVISDTDSDSASETRPRIALDTDSDIEPEAKPAPETISNTRSKNTSKTRKIESSDSD